MFVFAIFRSTSSSSGCGGCKGGVGTDVSEPNDIVVHMCGCQGACFYVHPVCVGVH